MTYKKWLDNEYKEWALALSKSTVHNFKDHSMVQRMLSIGTPFDYPVLQGLSPEIVALLIAIDGIGYENPGHTIAGDGARHVHYARKILDRKPKKIVEIGGGCGQLFATLRALGYEGPYFIYDLLEVKAFQGKYLDEVANLTKMDMQQSEVSLDSDTFCVSLYALGEFDDELKEFYVSNIINQCGHGFIIWNPHSGASSTITFSCMISEEFPLLNPGNKQLEW